jgi:hypothetical protein
VILQTDLPTPQAFDAYTFEVRQQTSPGQYSSPLFRRDVLIPDDNLPLPTTFGIGTGQSDGEVALVRLTAEKSGTPIALREVLVQLPRGRVGELRLSIASKCVGKLDCTTGQSCQPETGDCATTSVIQASSLATYSPDDLADAGVPTTGSANRDATTGDQSSPPDDSGDMTGDGGPGPIADAGTDGEGGSNPAPPAPTALPGINGACPTFTAGQADYSVTLADGGLTDGGGKASLGFTAWTGSGGGGPFVVYWHATGSTASEANTSLGPGGIAAITGMGGMVVAPTASSNQGLSTGNGVWTVGDPAYIDQILACAIQQGRVDTRRIHAVGYSAGALEAVYMWFVRSNYLASIASYSGGDITINTNGGTRTYPSNVPPAVAAHGPVGSDVLGVDFAGASQTFEGDVRKAGGLAIDCQDNGTHVDIAARFAVAPQVLKFLLDHPFKVSPDPYATGLPTGASVPDGGWPSYCKIVSTPDGG